MGVDASFFALNSKKRFYIDREFNVSHFMSVDSVATDRTYDLYHEAINNTVSKGELIELASTAKMAWLVDGRYGDDLARNQAHAGIMDSLIKAVSKLGDDERFKLIPDNSDEYYDKYDEFELVDLC